MTYKTLADAYVDHGHLFGTYTISEGSVNGKEYYEDDYGNGIWWYKNKWYIGHVDKKGTADGYLYSKLDMDCVHGSSDNEDGIYIECSVLGNYREKIVK